MNTVARILGSIEWAITLGVSYFLLQFGADRLSQLVASKYVYGSIDSVDPWLTLLGFGALLATFLLIHPRTRWYSAVVLTAVLVLASFTSLSFGDPQPFLVPLLGLGSSMVVLFSHRFGHDEREHELPSFVSTEPHG